MIRAPWGRLYPHPGKDAPGSANAWYWTNSSSTPKASLAVQPGSGEVIYAHPKMKLTSREPRNPATNSRVQLDQEEGVVYLL